PGGPPHGVRVMPPEIHAFTSEASPVPYDELPVGLVVAVPTLAMLDAGVEVVVRTGWEGPCAVVAVRGNTVPGFLGSVLPASPMWIGPALAVGTVMWLAVGPVVGRVRRLTRAVEAHEHPIALDGDDELAELARAFDAAVDAREAEAAARRQREEALREFVANTAHDVRIPLTVLRGHLVALETTHDPEVVRAAIVEAHYLGALLDDLAAHARLEEPRMDGPVELEGVVERGVGRRAPLGRRAGVTLHHGTPGEPVVVAGDVTLVEQALSNLAYNAVRHNREGGNVAVTLDLEGEGFVLAVADDGPGIPAEERARIVERGFTGTTARNRDTAGEGLGLAIVARVAALHGWTLTLDDAPEGGLLACLTGAVRCPQGTGG
ncbi:MAG: HAMP domain-containing histidine kinase, partial [Myxococcales bacterium]|nr:HAMP domain-containing histidine kinase [Myxococcales bacterium]